MEAAKAGAPYMSPRLEAVAFRGLPGQQTHEEALVELDALAFEADNPKTINHDPQREPPDVTRGTTDQGEAA